MSPYILREEGEYLKKIGVGVDTFNVDGRCVIFAHEGGYRGYSAWKTSSVVGWAHHLFYKCKQIQYEFQTVFSDALPQHWQLTLL